MVTKTEESRIKRKSGGAANKTLLTGPRKKDRRRRILLDATLYNYEYHIQRASLQEKITTRIFKFFLQPERRKNELAENCF
jgi:hypothetical protein